MQANFCTILQTKKYTTNSLDLLRVDGKVSKLQCYIVYVRTKWTQKKKSQCSETEDGKASLLWWGGGYSGGESAERSLVFVLMFFLIALIGFNKIIFWTLRLACVLRDPCRAAGGGWLARTTGISPQMWQLHFSIQNHQEIIYLLWLICSSQSFFFSTATGTACKAFILQNSFISLI